MGSDVITTVDQSQCRIVRHPRAFNGNTNTLAETGEAVEVKADGEEDNEEGNVWLNVCK